MYYSGSQHVDISREDAQKRPTLTSWWMTQDADLKNCQLQWKTEKGGRSVSWNTEQARLDDHDNDVILCDLKMWKKRKRNSLSVQSDVY